MDSTSLRYGSVCSGIESASVAWGPLGLVPAWFAEIEPFPCSVLSNHWPHVPNLGDMTLIAAGIRAGEIEAPDILVGGTPCQSWSIAGKGKGKDDPRGMLTFEFINIIEAAKPKFVVWENVPGIVSNDGGKHFAEFMDAIAGLGYTVNADILDAQFFGVAQRRRRVFLVCQRADILMKKKNVTSLNTGIIAVLGILRSILAVHQAGLGKKRVLLDVKCESASVGLRRKIACFLAHGEQNYLPWLNSLAESFQSVAQEQEFLGSTLGHTTKMGGNSKPTEATLFQDLFQGLTDEKQESSLNTMLSWKSELEELFCLVRSSTTSIQLKMTTDQKIYTYAKMLLSIGRYIAQSSHCSQTSFKAASSFLTLSKEFIDYARQTNKKLSGGERVFRFWDDFIREAEHSNNLVTDFGARTNSEEILFEFEGVRRDIAPCQQQGENITAGTLRGSDGGSDVDHAMAAHLQPTFCMATGQGGAEISEGGAPTLTCNHEAPIVVHGTDWNGGKMLSGAIAVRRLMPVEGERLQGFPDSHTDVPHKGKPASDTARYKAIGNSKAVPVIRWIGRRIQQALIAIARQ